MSVCAVWAHDSRGGRTKMTHRHTRWSRLAECFPFPARPAGAGTPNKKEKNDNASRRHRSETRGAGGRQRRECQARPLGQERVAGYPPRS